MTKYTFSLLIFLLSFSLFSKTKELIAVLPFNGQGLDASELVVLAEVLRKEINSSNKYEVMERLTLEKTLKSKGINNINSCDELACALVMGEFLSLRYVVQGRIGKIENTYTFYLRFIDTEREIILEDITEIFTGNSENLLKKVLPKLSNKIIRVRTKQLSVKKSSKKKPKSIKLSKKKSGKEESIKEEETIAWADDTKKDQSSSKAEVENEIDNKNEKNTTSETSVTTSTTLASKVEKTPKDVSTKLAKAEEKSEKVKKRREKSKKNSEEEKVENKEIATAISPVSTSTTLAPKVEKAVEVVTPKVAEVEKKPEKVRKRRARSKKKSKKEEVEIKEKAGSTEIATAVSPVSTSTTLASEVKKPPKVAVVEKKPEKVRKRRARSKKRSEKEKAGIKEKAGSTEIATAVSPVSTSTTLASEAKKPPKVAEVEKKPEKVRKRRAKSRKKPVKEKAGIKKIASNTSNEIKLKNELPFESKGGKEKKYSKNEESTIIERKAVKNSGLSDISLEKNEVISSTKGEMVSTTSIFKHRKQLSSSKKLNTIKKTSKTKKDVKKIASSKKAKSKKKKVVKGKADKKEEKSISLAKKSKKSNIDTKKESRKKRRLRHRKKTVKRKTKSGEVASKVEKKPKVISSKVAKAEEKPQGLKKRRLKQKKKSANDKAESKKIASTPSSISISTTLATKVEKTDKVDTQKAVAKEEKTQGLKKRLKSRKKTSDKKNKSALDISYTHSPVTVGDKSKLETFEAEEAILVDIDDYELPSEKETGKKEVVTVASTAIPLSTLYGQSNVENKNKIEKKGQKELQPEMLAMNTNQNSRKPKKGKSKGSSNDISVITSPVNSEYMPEDTEENVSIEDSLEVHYQSLEDEYNDDGYPSAINEADEYPDDPLDKNKDDYNYSTDNEAHTYAPVNNFDDRVYDANGNLIGGKSDKRRRRIVFFTSGIGAAVAVPVFIMMFSKKDKEDSSNFSLTIEWPINP